MTEQTDTEPSDHGAGTRASASKSARTRRALLLSLLAGALSAALLAVYLQRYESEVSGGEPVVILRAVKPIERGSLLASDMLVEAVVPASYVEARAVRASERAKVLGIKTAAQLDTQDALMWSDLVIASDKRELSSLVQPGNRAVTVQASSLGDRDGNDLIRPGDYVDVIATLKRDQEAQLASVVLLQRILVLAVGSETDAQAFRSGEPKQQRGANLEHLTLSLKVPEAQLLSLAKERGSLTVILRGDDVRITEGAPDMPVSSLFDAKFRTELQKGRSLGARPIRIADADLSGR